MENVEDLFEEADEEDQESEVAQNAGLVDWTFDPEILRLSIDQLVQSNRPRRYAPDEDSIEKLAAAIVEAGDLIVPIIVRQIGENKFEVVKGSRRVEALRSLGGDWHRNIQCLIITTDEENAAQVALLATTSARPLNPLEIADGVVEYVAFASARFGRRISREAAVARLRELNRAYEAARGRAGKRGEGEDAQSYRSRVLERMAKELRLEFARAEEFVFGACGLRLPAFCRNHLPLLDLPSDVLERVRSGRLEYSKANIVRHIDDRAARAQVMDAELSREAMIEALREWRNAHHKVKARTANPYREFSVVLQQREAFEDAGFRIRLKLFLESENLDASWLAHVLDEPGR